MTETLFLRKRGEDKIIQPEGTLREHKTDAFVAREIQYQDFWPGRNSREKKRNYLEGRGRIINWGVDHWSVERAGRAETNGRGT